MSGTSISVSLSGDARIDGILSSIKWNMADITYAFPGLGSGYEAAYPGNAPNEGFGELSSAQQSLYFDALNTGVETNGSGGNKWMSVEGFTLQKITAITGGDPTLRAAYSTDPGNGSYAYVPGADTFSGDAWFGSDSPLNFRLPVMGNEVWRTTLHEIGHQLGLKNGHEAGFGNSAVLPANTNSMEYSVMTNSSFVGDPDTAGSFTNETFGFAQSWMMYDIAALQYIYGADFTHNGGNTSYTWSSTTGQMFVDGLGQGVPGANRIFLTIWDGGGTDTYNLSNYTTNLQIDLAPGGHSKFSDGQLANLGGGPNGGFANGNVYNALQFQGDARSLIENVVGGSGDDTIRGNGANNAFSGSGGKDTLFGLEGSDHLSGNDGDDVLKGGGGADTLFGNADNDTLKGGGGADALNGGTGTDFATYTDSTEGVNVSLDTGLGLGGSAEGDTLAEIENLIGSNHADTLAGNALANALDGGGGDDLLNGGLGADAMTGGAGNDTYFVDNAGDGTIETVDGGYDTVRSAISFTLTANLERLTLTGIADTNAIGNGLANLLNGNAGRNLLNGGGGVDILRGGLGNDVYVTDGGDTLVEIGTGGIDVVKSSVNYALGANLERLVLLGNQNLNGRGNTGGNVLLGNAGANVLDGELGADRLAGGAGNDAFVFSTLLGPGNVDALTDFVAVDDAIRLDNAVFLGLVATGATPLAANLFKALNTGSVDADDRILYDRVNGNLYFDRDGSGTTYAAIKFADTVNGTALTNADVFII